MLKISPSTSNWDAYRLDSAVLICLAEKLFLIDTNGFCCRTVIYFSFIWE